MGFDLGGGVLGDAFGAITNTIDAGTGGWWSDSSTKASAKRNLRYNQWLQASNQEFQKFMAQNAHQMEVQDLINAGLNPALSATGSSAGSIAGKSSPQSTSPGSAVGNLGNIVDSINGLRKTNADIDRINAEIKNMDANTLATIEMLPISKREKEALIKFTDERARGITNSSSYSGNFGNKLIGGGGSYSKTTVR